MMVKNQTPPSPLDFDVDGETNTTKPSRIRGRNAALLLVLLAAALISLFQAPHSEMSPNAQLFRLTKGEKITLPKCILYSSLDRGATIRVIPIPIPMETALLDVWRHDSAGVHLELIPAHTSAIQ